MRGGDRQELSDEFKLPYTRCPHRGRSANPTIGPSGVVDLRGHLRSHNQIWFAPLAIPTQVHAKRAAKHFRLRLMFGEDALKVQSCLSGALGQHINKHNKDAREQGNTDSINIYVSKTPEASEQDPKGKAECFEPSIAKTLKTTGRRWEVVPDIDGLCRK